MRNRRGPDFEGVYRRALETNYKEFNPRSSTEKIRSFARMAGESEADIMRKAEKDLIFRWVFIKDPKKQNIYEKEAARWLEDLPSVADFRSYRKAKLARRGTAMAVPGLAGTAGAALARDVDFSWRTGKYKVYAAHTYTHDSGGTQGKQYGSIRSFIGSANRSSSPRRIFIAIADGTFTA